MLRYIKTAINLTTLHWKTVLFLYGINLVLGLVVAKPFYTTLIVEANGSMALDSLLSDFDYMIFSDFMRLHGKALRPLFLLALALSLIYIFINALFTGAVFAQFKQELHSFSVLDFIKSGFPTFGKYLLLLLIQLFVLFCVLFLAGLFFFIFALIAEGGSEREYILWMIPPSILMLLFFTIVVVICDYARFTIFQDAELTPWKAFGRATNFVFSHFSTIGLYGIILGIGLMVLLVYLFFDSAIGMTSGITVFIMFIIQQAVVFARVFLKIINYAVVKTFYLASDRN